MKGRDLIGRRIVRVDQTYVPAYAGFGGCWNLDRITFDDGRIVYFTVAELDGDYAVIGHIIKNPPDADHCQTCGVILDNGGACTGPKNCDNVGEVEASPEQRWDDRVRLTRERGDRGYD